jgi:hypothetical protein
LSTLIHLKEPTLRFCHGQHLAHPKDGLTLFGPYTQIPGSLRFGVIGTTEGIALFGRWTARIARYIPAYKGAKFRTKKESEHNKLAHQYYPGFQSAFRILWNDQPEIVCEVPEDSLAEALRIHERHTRVAAVVKTYAKRLTRLHYQSEQKPDLWFVVIPRDVFLYCRPRSDAPKDYLPGTKAEDAAQWDLFVEKEDADSFADEYREALTFKPDFHNQLKARLLKHQIITQILQHDTLEACLRSPDEPLRDVQDPATTSWNVTTSIYYKTRRRPWILSDPREGVCYMGLVFKRLNQNAGGKNACCGAQMFLEDGIGMVFKGALGPWYSEDTRECHLDSAEAGKLLETALKSYADSHDGKPPDEIFVHGSVRFNDAEWQGFSEAAAKRGTRVTGVRIRKLYDGIKLYRRGTMPVLRGTAMIVSPRKAFLWTSGFTPRLNTYPGWNAPNPLDIEICNGDADIETVLRDIMRLTKLNYNNCNFADGLPITLKFASKVGDILTTLPSGEGEGDEEDRTPLPFWHYI